MAAGALTPSKISLIPLLVQVAALKAGDMRDKELSAVWHGVASLPSGILQVSRVCDASASAMMVGRELHRWMCGRCKSAARKTAPLGLNNKLVKSACIVLHELILHQPATVQASAPALATLLSVTHPISMATWGAHAICTTLWALGRLEAQPSDAWWAELFEVTKDMLRRMNGQEACTFMWALHRWVMGCYKYQC
jgi:hypothetical protein